LDVVDRIFARIRLRQNRASFFRRDFEIGNDDDAFHAGRDLQVRDENFAIRAAARCDKSAAKSRRKIVRMRFELEAYLKISASVSRSSATSFVAGDSRNDRGRAGSQAAHEWDFVGNRHAKRRQFTIALRGDTIGDAQHQIVGCGRNLRRVTPSATICILVEGSMRTRR
jgi:hypothetical protein